MHVNSFLVRLLNLSHHQIKNDIALGNVLIDDQLALPKQEVNELNTIKYKDKIIQEGKQLFYYAYNKPVGVESTLNMAIPNNLVEATGIKDYFFPIGRLDKASEGLMILTNDGNLYSEIINKENNIEKVYEVEVNGNISDIFLKTMGEGVLIMGNYTKPCEIIKLATNKFRITLIEGRNRQIRRMCYKLGLEVLVLKRIAIGKLNLNEIKINTWQLVNRQSII